MGTVTSGTGEQTLAILSPYRQVNTLRLGYKNQSVNPLNAKLNPIRHLLALEAGRHIVHVSRITVKERTQAEGVREQDD